MIVYAESSAVLAWLLNEAERESVRLVLAGALRVVTSRLTIIECSRALDRSRVRGRLDEGAVLAAHRLLAEASAGWVIMDIVGEVVTRASRPFPREPVRTLDALHLASAAIYHESLGTMAMLSLDERIRANWTALGFDLAA